MSSFKEISPKDYRGNPFEEIGSDWMLIAAKKKDAFAFIYKFFKPKRENVLEQACSKTPLPFLPLIIRRS